MTRKRLPGATGALYLITHPLVVIGAIWGLGLFMYSISANFGESMLYFRFLAHAERIRDDVSVFSFIWLALAFGAFVLGGFVSRDRAIAIGAPVPTEKLHRARRAILIAFGVTATVAFLWVGVAIMQFGGLGRMVALATSENARAREVLLMAAFPGGRLISTGFIGISVFCASIIGQHKERTPIGFMTPFYAIFFFCMAYLAIIPIIMSGRVNFFVAVMGSYIAYSIARGKFVGLAYLPIPIVALSIVWGATDYYAMGHVMEVAPEQQAVQGLLFYFYNDMSNALNPIGNLDGHWGYGWNSLRFIFFMTFTNVQFVAATRQNMQFAEQFRPGGEFPLLTAPYADFGLFGLVLIIFFGWIAYSMHKKAFENRLYASTYGLVFGGLVLSIHSAYVTNQEIVYNIILAAVLVSATEGKKLIATSSRLKGVRR